LERNPEIEALISLVDDEDESIYFQIRDKLLSYGVDAVPYLEEAWDIVFKYVVIGLNEFEQIDQVSQNYVRVEGDRPHGCAARAREG